MVNIACSAGTVTPPPGKETASSVPMAIRPPPRPWWMTMPPTKPAKTAAPAEAEVEAPVIPRGPTRPPAKAPRVRPPIPNGADPGWITVTGPVHNYSILLLRSQIARRIALIDLLGRDTINLHVGQVMQWRSGRDRVNRLRNRSCHCPRTIDGGRGKPHAILASIPRGFVNFNDWCSTIHDIE